MSLPKFDLLQDQLLHVENHMRAQAEDCHPDLADAINHLIDAGGKRIRPTITLLIGQILGADPKAALNLAAAVEMLHTATLVHDDLIDGALLRRGMPTINSEWSPAATVLTGDFIFARAAKLAAATDSVAVMDMFAETLSTVVNGEINQYFVSRGLASRKDYYARIYAKTASMFELAAGAAALLAPVDENIRLSARQFGYEIGMAFQIMDDVLDFTGDQNAVGKPLGSDLQIGLITLPAIYYYESNPNDADIISVIRRNGHNASQLDRLVGNIRSSTAIRESEIEADEFVQRGLGILEDFPVTPSQQTLKKIANFIVERET